MRKLLILITLVIAFALVTGGSTFGFDRYGHCAVMTLSSTSSNSGDDHPWGGDEPSDGDKEDRGDEQKPMDTSFIDMFVRSICDLLGVGSEKPLSTPVSIEQKQRTSASLQVGYVADQKVTSNQEYVK